MRLAVLAALIVGVMVQSGEADEPVADLSRLDWHLAAIDGQPPEWAASINLGEAGRISGSAPCNRFSGTLTRDGTGFVTGVLAATKMACAELQGEAVFFQLLSGITKAEQMPGSLTLSGGGHEMRFIQPID